MSQKRSIIGSKIDFRVCQLYRLYNLFPVGCAGSALTTKCKGKNSGHFAGVIPFRGRYNPPTILSQ